MTASRERLVVVGLGVAGAAIALLAATRPWLAVTVKDPLVGSGRLHPSGRVVAPLVPAAALVALAASVAAVTLRRVGRQIAGLLLVAAGGAVASAAVNVLTGPGRAAEESVRLATGRTGGLSSVTSVATVWPWVGVVAGVPIVLAGAVTVVRGRSWTGLSSRYEPPAAEPAGPAPSTGTSAADLTALADPGAAADARDPDDAWDALTRGEDPTR